MSGQIKHWDIVMEKMGNVKYPSTHKTKAQKRSKSRKPFGYVIKRSNEIPDTEAESRNSGNCTDDVL